MRKYYEEKDVSGSVNASSELTRENDIIGGYELEEWTQPVMTENGTVGGDTFALDTNPVTWWHGEPWYAFNDKEDTSDYFHAHTYMIIYNPFPLLLKGLTYYCDATKYQEKKERIIVYGSDTGGFNGEEEIIGTNCAGSDTNTATITAQFPDNLKAFKYHKIYWAESMGWCWVDGNKHFYTYFNLPKIYNMKLSAYKQVFNKGFFEIKQHIVTSLDGRFYTIPAQTFNISALDDGKHCIFSNCETKKIEVLKGTYSVSAVKPEFENENIIWLDTGKKFPLRLVYITDGKEEERNELVKIGSMEVLNGEVLKFSNDEFNAQKAEKPVLISPKCCYNGKAYLPVLPDFIYYKQTESGQIEADETDYDFFAVRPNFNVKDGGIMCFSKGG